MRTHDDRDRFLTASLLLTAVLAAKALAATEFVCTIREDGTGDFTTLGAWNEAIRCNLTSAGTLTAGWENRVGDFIADDTALTWDDGAGSGTLVHMTSVARSGQDAFMVKNAAGAPLAQGHVVTDGANSFSVANAPDSVIAVARIEGKWDNPDGPVSITTGWTCSETNYVRVFTEGQARHQGKWTETAHRIVRTTGGSILSTSVPCIELDGLQLLKDPAPGETGNMQGLAVSGGAGSTYFKNGLITATPAVTNITATGTRGIHLNSSATTLNVINTIIWHPVRMTATQSRAIWPQSGTANLYNCILFNWLQGAWSAPRFYNTATFNHGSATFGQASVVSNSASTVGFATDPNHVHWTNGAADWDKVFVDRANGDFRLRKRSFLLFRVPAMTAASCAVQSRSPIGRYRRPGHDEVFSVVAHR